MIRLTEWARRQGIAYVTAFRWARADKVPGPEAAHCWRCGVWLPDSEWGGGYGYGNGNGFGFGFGDGYSDGNGHGDGWGNGWGYGHGDGWGAPLPLCPDPLACAIQQAKIASRVGG